MNLHSFLLLIYTQTFSSTLAFYSNVASAKIPFIPSLNKYNDGSSLQSTTSSTVKDVDTEPIEGMRPGTSGLRKKVEVWQEETNYIENFIQSLLNVAVDLNDGNMLDTVIVAGDGRYYNQEAMQRIFRVLAGNGVTNIWVPKDGIMSTPAVSACIRNREDGKAQGAIILTASHNPGGPGEDFGIKYNEGFGQPAGEEFTEALYKESLKIKSYKSIETDQNDLIDIHSEVGTTIQVVTDESSSSSSSSITIIDPFDDYIKVLESCFDFEALKKFSAQYNDFQLLFDGMHGAGGPFAQKVFVDMLGLPESSLLRCNPLPDFDKCHPDPNLTYASSLIQKMGLLPDGSINTDISDASSLPTLGAANDGDGDRNLIAGSQCFVTPSDSLAIIADHWRDIPHFAKRGSIGGVARSMPTSAALDVVAQKNNIPYFVTPTGWKFFGNLMSSKELFDKHDYTPFLCGEESFGTGSCHIREKDGLWAVLAWMSILMKANEGNDSDSLSVGVKDIVKKHWETYGRHFYCRYDYEGVDSDKANELMDHIRNEFISKDPSNSDSSIQLENGEEFSYTDPVDGSQTFNQGLILNFKNENDASSRVVFRLSGTGSSGATIRMYIEQYEQDASKFDQAAPIALKELADYVLDLVCMEKITGRNAPTVIT